MILILSLIFITFFLKKNFYFFKPFIFYNQNTPTTSSSANILPNNRKLSESGFVKSSNMFIGRSIGVGCTYFEK